MRQKLPILSEQESIPAFANIIQNARLGSSAFKNVTDEKCHKLAELLPTRVFEKRNLFWDDGFDVVVACAEVDI